MGSNRAKPPNKAIESAILQIEAMGWSVEVRQRHGFAIARCPYNDGECRDGKYCQFSIWSTPRNPVSHARSIVKNAKKCERRQDG